MTPFFLIERDLLVQISTIVKYLQESGGVQNDTDCQLSISGNSWSPQ